MFQDDSQQFGDVYDQYVDKIYRFVFLKVNSQAVAQDLTSETFTRTLEYVNRNKDKKIDNMQAFLYRTALNMVTDYYRKKSRQDVPLEYESQHVVEVEVPERDRADVAAMQNEQIGQIRTALAQMEGEHVDVVMWHYVEDLSTKEIADILGRPEGTIRVMLHRGLKELRKQLSS